MELASRAGLTLRLLGRVGVLVHCPASLAMGGERPIENLDLAVAPKQRRRLAELLRSDAYAADKKFNSRYIGSRMLFYGPLGQLHIIVGAFEMNHAIELRDRLHLDTPTLPVTDLLLAKLQILRLETPDAADALLLLREHEVAREEGDVINIGYIETLVRADWGLWRTISGNFDRLIALTSDVDAIDRIQCIRSALDNIPKSTRFKLRARLGELLPWYILRDEWR